MEECRVAFAPESNANGRFGADTRRGARYMSCKSLARKEGSDRLQVDGELRGIAGFRLRHGAVIIPSGVLDFESLIIVDGKPISHRAELHQ